MIRTKEDFYYKYLEVPQNISKKKWMKIVNKFKKLGFYAPLRNFGDECSRINFIGYGNYKLFARTYPNMKTIFFDFLNPKKAEIISIKEFLEEETMTSGYLYIDPKDIEKADKEARKIYGDIFDKGKTFTIERTPCPQCGYTYKEEIENREKEGIFYKGVWYNDNEVGMKALKEDFLKNQQGDIDVHREFSSPFKGLDFCYRNPNKEIEVYNTYYKKTYRVKYDKDLKRIVWFGDYAGNFGIERKWRVLANMTYVYNWKNIKEYKSISSIEMTLEEAVKSGLRFGFNGETWRTSPKGFILDSKGNSLKSSVLLNNLKTKVKIIEN